MIFPVLVYLTLRNADKLQFQESRTLYVFLLETGQVLLKALEGISIYRTARIVSASARLCAELQPIHAMLNILLALGRLA